MGVGRGYRGLMPTVPTLRKALKRSAPSLGIERALWTEGHEVVVGMDEVGPGRVGRPAHPRRRGGAEGPPGQQDPRLEDAHRGRAGGAVRPRRRAGAWRGRSGHASEEECDELGMSEAQRLAARRALDGLGLPADRVLLDGKWDFVGDGTSQMLVKGDARCLSIAAASILAKVTRDRIMRAEAEHHPYWAFELNKGYPCPKHKMALQGIGPSAIHRRSWVFMDHLSWGGVPRFVPPPPIDPALRNQQSLF